MIKKTTLLIALLLLGITAGFASEEQKNVRFWDEGALQWSDFAGNPAIRTLPTYFSGHLEIRTAAEHEEGSKLNPTIPYKTQALAVMDRSESYADSSYCTKQRLRYHQLQFDMLEVLRRRLQADLNTGMTGIEADNRLKYYQRIYTEQMADVARLTVNGSNDQRLQEYEYTTRKQIDEFLLPSVPEVKPGKVSYGLFIGTGTLIPTGDVAKVFDYSWLFNIGLTGGYGRWMLKADISYGQPRFEDMKMDIYGKANRWAMNRYAKQLSGSVSLGFRVIDTKRFALTPHVGGGWSSYTWDYADFDKNENTPEPDDMKIASEVMKKTVPSFNVMAGIDLDWKFHTVVSDKSIFMPGKRERYTSMLRLTPYFMRAEYSKFVPERNGFQIGISLSYVGLARALSIE